jgi:hypothetical protein
MENVSVQWSVGLNAVLFFKRLHLKHFWNSKCVKVTRQNFTWSSQTLVVITWFFSSWKGERKKIVFNILHFDFERGKNTFSNAVKMRKQPSFYFLRDHCRCFSYTAMIVLKTKLQQISFIQKIEFVRICF